MLGNKFLVILVKPLFINAIEIDKAMTQKIESLLLDMNQRYQILFEKKEEGWYACSLPLQGNCMDMISYLHILLKPYEALFTLGIATQEKSENKARSQAYQYAVNAMKQLERQRKRRDYRYLYQMINVSNKYKAFMIAFNMMMQLECNIQNNWTQKQRDMIYYVYFEKQNQKTTAERFNVSQPNVHQVLKKANYVLYRDLMQSYQRILEDII